MDKTSKKAFLTGASSGIGQALAPELAARGYDLVLVARDQARMQTLAEKLRKETGVKVEIIAADLTDDAQLAKVEQRLREDAGIGLLVNNAGMAAPGGFAAPDRAVIHKLLALNVTAVTQLAAAVTPRFIAQKAGAIINIGSVVGLAPEIGMGAYGATKSFVLTLSQSLATEAGPHGVYVQAVLPAATRTEIWERSGRNVNDVKGVMEVDELVDAALVGFDRREAVTIPPLPDVCACR